VAVDCGSVDPVDAGLDRAGQRSDASGLIASDQEPAGIASTERNLRNFEAGAAEEALSHAVSLSRSRSRTKVTFQVTFLATPHAAGSAESCQWPSSASRCETRSSVDTCTAQAWSCSGPAASAPCHRKHAPAT